MREQDQQLVRAFNAKQLALLADTTARPARATWSSDVLVIPCEGPLSIIDAQCNAIGTSSLDTYASASCSAVYFRRNAGALLLLGDHTSAYRQDFALRAHHSLGLGHATTTKRLLEPGLMSWDSVFFSNMPPFNTLGAGFKALRPNSYLEGVRGPVVVAPNICKQYECGTMALAFLDFPAGRGDVCLQQQQQQEGLLDWQALFEQVAASIVAEYGC